MKTYPEDKAEVKDQQKTMAFSELPRTVPKYCTSIQVNVLENGNIVLSMIYAESGEKPMAVLIDRIFIDKEHAAALANILQEAATNVKST
jgi:hypothetical protein